MTKTFVREHLTKASARAEVRRLMAQVERCLASVAKGDSKEESNQKLHAIWAEANTVPEPDLEQMLWQEVAGLWPNSVRYLFLDTFSTDAVRYGMGELRRQTYRLTAERQKSGDQVITLRMVTGVADMSRRIAPEILYRLAADLERRIGRFRPYWRLSIDAYRMTVTIEVRDEETEESGASDLSEIINELFLNLEFQDGASLE